MSKALQGKTAVIMGASSGIGAHTAQLLARHGADVVLLSRRRDRLEVLAQELQDSFGMRTWVYDVDVCDAAAVSEVMARVWSEGGADLLFNNAGIAESGPSEDFTAAQWDRVLAVNLSGVFYTAQQFGRHLIASKREGVIVNTASILGLRAKAGVAAYCASKAGVISLTETLAVEWAKHGIRVNAIAPGYIETDLNRSFLRSRGGQGLLESIPQGRFGTLEGLESTLLYLFCDQSSMVTGQVLAVDGGHSTGL